MFGYRVGKNMLKVKIIAIGKCREDWLQAALAEYEKRLSPFLKLSWIQAENNSRFARLLQKEHYIALDCDGVSMDSMTFSQKLHQSIEKYGSRIAFAIGGPEGFPSELLQKAETIWSLSRLTFTHQLARLVLIEQIYRSFEIVKKSPYHK